MADVNRVFHYLEQPKKRNHVLSSCKTLMISPTTMRTQLMHLIDKEIKAAKAKKPASIILKLNSLSDEMLIDKLYEAAIEGVKLKLIIRGIFCLPVGGKKFKGTVKAISIVDEYLEHSRIMIFHNGGKEKTYISSADWMVRNLDHRIEVACPILGKNIQQELKDILQIQLKGNIKARILDNDLSNNYVNPRNTKKVRSQVETYNYLFRKTV